jgi:cytochrome b-561
MASYSTSVLAHLFGIIALILMLVWLLHYQGGIEYDSSNPLRVFNVKHYSSCLFSSLID